jgi:hypothetical protein
MLTDLFDLKLVNLVVGTQLEFCDDSETKLAALRVHFSPFTVITVETFVKEIVRKMRKCFRNSHKQYIYQMGIQFPKIVTS